MAVLTDTLTDHISLYSLLDIIPRRLRRIMDRHAELVSASIT